ncbi:GNAT family N-acetyltransferase [Ectothiorhodospiraceae bacterium BW-2]|nr:GNAT family N-acetyltransferase [Ectothiorhodospiraceae bacterium BW-2]
MAIMKRELISFAAPYRADIISIRQSVFCQEQGVPLALELDGRDDMSKHALIQTDSGHYVATGRVQPDGHIGRVAVLADYRRLGLGTEVMWLLMGEARRRGLPRVYLGAQQQAVPFYQRLGFQIYGERFMEAGIEHRSMEYRLL